MVFYFGAILNQLNEDEEVKVVSAVYQLPSGLKCRVDDYRTRGWNDDIYYRKTKSLLLRRGLAAIYCWPDYQNPVFVLAGLPKFGNSDEKFTENLEERDFKLKRRIYMVKENGETGHLAFFVFKEKWYAVVGSKNVHIVFCVDSKEEAVHDLAYYDSLKNQRLTTAIANTWLLMRHNASARFGNVEMRRFLFDNQMTLVFEAVFNNHIVNYPENELVIAFALTIPQLQPLEQQGLAMNPEKSLDLLRKWGFQTPKFDIVEQVSFQEFDRKYETLLNIEGAVVYEIFSNNNLSEGEEIVGRMYKHKNHVYIIRRMARELIKRQAVYSAWLTRFAKCHIETKGLESEIERLLAFYVWLTLVNRTANCTNKLAWSEYIQRCFKSLLEEFDFKFGKNRRATEQFISQAQTTLIPPPTEQEEGSSKNDDNLAILLVGLQGSGKTRLRNGLFHVLGPEKTTYVNQDELGGQRKAFIQELRDFRKSAGKVMIVDKCNHLYRLREDVYTVYSKVIVCEFFHPEGHAEMVKLCEERIQQRGLSHLTLPFSTEIKSIINRFCDEYEPVNEAEKLTNDYLPLNITEKPEVNVKIVFDYLKQNFGLLSSIDQLEIDEERLKQTQIEYEAKIRGEALKKVLFWRASCEVGTVRRFFMPMAPRIESLHYKWGGRPVDRFGEEYHVTLIYDRKLTEKEVDEMELLSRPSLRVRTVSLAFNEKAAAVRIVREGRLAQLCEKEHPHITLACADGVAPVYLNEMLESGLFDEIGCDFELELVINPVFM